MAAARDYHRPHLESCGRRIVRPHVRQFAHGHEPGHRFHAWIDRQGHSPFVLSVIGGVASTTERIGRGTGAQVQACWGPSQEEALRVAHEVWPNACIQGQASQERPSPAHFEELAAMVQPGDIADKLPHGPDVAQIVATIREAVRGCDPRARAPDRTRPGRVARDGARRAAATASRRMKSGRVVHECNGPGIALQRHAEFGTHADRPHGRRGIAPDAKAGRELQVKDHI